MSAERSHDGSWEAEIFALLDDLEAQAEAGFAADREAELADRSRAEYGEVTLAARLMASLGMEVTLTVSGVGRLRGVLTRVARDWLLLTAGSQDWLVRQQAIGTLTGASDRAVPEIAWPAVARLGIASALRRLADSGERCVLHLLDGSRQQGELRRVGADFVEVDDEGRLALVSLVALAAVQRRD